MTSAQANDILRLLKNHYPNAGMILRWNNKLELLISIILSAQCTDKMVNRVTGLLFPTYRKTYYTLQSFYTQYTKLVIPQNELFEMINFAYGSLSTLESAIRPTGFFRNKAKYIQLASQLILNKYHGELPQNLDQLQEIPGVGRKTANVFLSNAFHIIEGIAVDTHVKKQAYLLGLTNATKTEKIETQLMKLFDKKDWYDLTYLLISHGRNMRRKNIERYRCTNKQCILCH